MLKVTIIGAGNMGRGIGMRLAGKEIQLQVLAPTVEDATGLAAEVGGRVTGAGWTTRSKAMSWCWRHHMMEPSSSSRNAEGT